MIKSQFTRKMRPFILAGAVSIGFLTNSIVQKNKNTVVEPQQTPIESVEGKTKKPLTERNGLWGTLLGLSVLGSATCLSLAKAVDVRHKDGHQNIDDIFDATSITDEELMSAFEESCREKDANGIEFDREELKKEYEPRTSVITTMMDSIATRITAVTRNAELPVGKDKEKIATKQFLYMVEELKSAVNYGYEVEDDAAKIRMHYFYDKATTPTRKWSEKEAEYKEKYPNIDFSDYGSDEEAVNFLPELVEDGEINPNLVTKVSSKYLIPILENVKNVLLTTKDGERFNKYDRRACLEMVNKAISDLESGKIADPDLMNRIRDIYVFRQM